jgi:hypothetical protein
VTSVGFFRLSLQEEKKYFNPECHIGVQCGTRSRFFYCTPKGVTNTQAGHFCQILMEIKDHDHDL